MKTFKQFLREAEANQLREMIERDCGPFLREARGMGLLYRGIKPGGEGQHVTDGEGNRLEYITKSTRTDRRPRDTSVGTHDNLNKWFKKKFGWNVRSEGVFCFGEGFLDDIVTGYGLPHIIFPIGEIEYVWSGDITDLSVAIEAEGLSYSDITPEAIAEWLDTLGFTDKGLHDVIDSGFPSEIIVKCNKYYAFPIEYREELKKALGIE